MDGEAIPSAVFPAKVPAVGDIIQSIDELLRRLEDEDNGEYVYRGQLRDYGLVIPSNLRNAVKAVDGAAVHLDRRILAAERTVRAAEQGLLRQGMVKAFGAGVGHILAQQYGLGSDVLDVSSSPRIAAFFATREWPTCRHISNRANAPGVIYRWRKPGKSRTPTELKADTLIAGVTPTEERDPAPVPAIVEFPEAGTAEYLLVRDSQDAWAKFPTAIFNYREIAAALEDHLARADGPYVVGWAFEGLPASRWAEQAGGFFRPEILYRAHVGLPPEDGFKIVDDSDLGEPRLDRTVFGGLPDAVTDAGKIGPPTVFRFQHTSSRIEVSPEELWPAADRDPLFGYVALMAWGRHGEYFDEMRANYPWERITGLIDRGYYPEHEDEAYERAEWEVFKSMLPEVE